MWSPLSSKHNEASAETASSSRCDLIHNSLEAPSQIQHFKKNLSRCTPPALMHTSVHSKWFIIWPFNVHAPEMRRSPSHLFHIKHVKSCGALREARIVWQHKHKYIRWCKISPATYCSRSEDIEPPPSVGWSSDANTWALRGNTASPQRNCSAIPDEEVKRVDCSRAAALNLNVRLRLQT